MKELNNLSLEKVSGGVVLITKEADIDEGNLNGCIHFHDGVRYIAADDSNRPFNQRQHSPLFGNIFDAVNYANERGWSAKSLHVDFQI